LEIRPGRLSCAAGSRIQAGAVTFKTIVPGWCSGRIIRIHVMIRTLSSSGSVLTEFTTQLFFDQTLINALTTSVSPCRSRGLPDTSNAEDSIGSARCS
jgi:protocatechuate 3,4-dioxygenase beta subunit